MLKQIFTLLISILFLCGCSSKNYQEEISFSSWGSITEVNIIKKIISDFEKENPQIKINFIHIPQNYYTKLHLLFASNTAPDVIFINNLYLPIYSNQLLDLSEKIKKEKFFPQAVESLSYNGYLLAVPRDISNLVFYINTDLIKTLPYNWKIEDLLELAQKNTTSNTWGIGFEEDVFYALPYLRYYGEEFNDKLLPEASQGLNFYKDLRDKYKIAPTSAQVGSSTLAQMFLDKKIGIYLSGRWMFPKIKEKANFDWEIKSFPIGQNPLPCDTSGWAISKNSKHIDSALKFVEFISSKKSSEYFTQTGLIVPARIETAEILKNGEHNEQVFVDIIKNSKNTYVDKNFKKRTQRFNDYLKN